jgi:23S rRNA (uracil1939-C5)-methyltransferase
MNASCRRNYPVNRTYTKTTYSEKSDRIDSLHHGRYARAVEKTAEKKYRARAHRDRTQNAPQEGRNDYEARCPHYPACVGCPFIDVPYPEQLVRKQARVRDALAEHGSLRDLEVPPVVPSPERFGYRARVKLVVRRKRGDVMAGLYVPQSHGVIDISGCPVHPRSVNQVVQYLKKKIVELGIQPYDERDDSGDLRYLDLRYSFARKELSLTLVTRHPALPQGGALSRALHQRFPFIVGVIQNVNETHGNVIWGGANRMLGGSETIMERIGDLKLVFPAGVFSQANPFTARKLYERVREWAALTGTETVLDLYCGVGPISLFLAPSARQLWAVDDSEQSIATAKQNARRNGRGNCRFFAGDVAATLAQWRVMLPGAGLVVLNPPRKGVQPAALGELIALAAPRLIYVSCEPKSLARDLEKLIEAGYRVRRIQPFDMFPQTAEVETVVELAH